MLSNQNRLSPQASPSLSRRGWMSQMHGGLELGDLKPQSGAGVVPPGARSRGAGLGGARRTPPGAPAAAGLQREREGGGRWGRILKSVQSLG